MGVGSADRPPEPPIINTLAMDPAALGADDASPGADDAPASGPGAADDDDAARMMMRRLPPRIRARRCASRPWLLRLPAGLSSWDDLALIAGARGRPAAALADADDGSTGSPPGVARADDVARTVDVNAARIAEDQRNSRRQA